ncbi:TlpA disulfide reductase family protein [Thiovibrio frasassiensis]|jgi:cytochrome c biogenesis protein CcmG/thiol:disulfide interchange protein DsbE|uniref:TlpA family protein disulfide reductase n=1 Tax=Thiovibrio frasassiensis TaxID=2984131 RepID=A0A9X4RLK4_9BACT|nr:TlpA disulfide reductase family protein [Thiovibrio frasassiensis]MDG4475824.1 TlpA family protein disulfide reductase [Thiovibrio frasassiensis]
MQIMKAMAAKARILTITLALFTLMVGAAQGATKMPSFALPSVKDGAMVKASAYQGQAMLINFFATWCPPCRKEIPDFIKLQKEYGPKGFTVIGISTDQGGSSLVDKFAQKMEINYPVLLSDSETPRAFGGILGIPTSFLVNKEGNVVKRYDGYVDHQTLVNDLNAILK